jgi:hypothetical protein
MREREEREGERREKTTQQTTDTPLNSHTQTDRAWEVKTKKKIMKRR